MTTEWLDTARRLAVDAAREVMRLRDQPIAHTRKADQSIVTQADLNADKILRDGLLQAFPDHGILSEEDGLSGRLDSDYFWLIDPLDGTKAYAKGIPGFCIMLGLLYKGDPVLGVFVDPMDMSIYEAIKGGGAFVTHNGRRERLQVSLRHDYSEMPLVVSTGFPEKTLEVVRQELNGPLIDPVNSVGIKVGRLVRQEADIYINHHSVHLWDTCAPQMILEEAGGVITQLDGRKLTYEIKQPFSHTALTLASNGTRHEDLVSLMAEKNIFLK